MPMRPRYMRAYRHAIGAIGEAWRRADRRSRHLGQALRAASALRADCRQRAACPRSIAALTELVLAAKQADIGLTVDAEEADRLEISLDIIAAVMADPRIAGWDGFGLAIQAYQKRCASARRLARGTRPPHRPPHPGAARERRLLGHRDQARADRRATPTIPVFTRKAATDVSWIACARRMLGHRDAIFPAFATHNAQSAGHHARAGLRSGWAARPSRCSACTAWARRSTTGWSARAARCASMRRSARMRICSPISCAACWRTARIRASCIRAVDRAVPEGDHRRRPGARLRAQGAGPQSAHPAAARDLSGPREFRRASTLPTAPSRPPLLAADPRAAPHAHIPGAGDRARDPRARRPPPSDRHRRRMRTTRRDRSRARRAPRGPGAHGTRRAGSHRAAILDRAADLDRGRSRHELLILLAREGGTDAGRRASPKLREAADFCRYYARPRARALRRRARPARPDRRAQHLVARRARRVRLHLAVELPARDLHWARSPPRSPPAMRLLAKPAEQTPLIAAARGRTAAPGRRAAGRCCICCRATGASAPRSVRDPPHRRRRLHRQHGDRAGHRPHAGRARPAR